MVNGDRASHGVPHRALHRRGEQPDGDAWPEDNPARRDAYNRMVREVAAEHPRTVSVVDLDEAACPGGQYASTVQAW